MFITTLKIQIQDYITQTFLKRRVSYNILFVKVMNNYS